MTRRLLFRSIAVAGSLAVALVQAPPLSAGGRTAPGTTAAAGTAAVVAITKGMQRQRASQRRTEYAAELRRKHGVQFLIEPPRFPMAPPTGPSMGPADAPVTVVEFSDFQCPFCARSAETVKQLVGKYGGKIRLVFQDFPLPNHKDAPKAAEAAACAHDQGKFWEMHDRLFQNQNKLAVADLKQHALTIGLDAPAFDACLDGGKHAAVWQRGKSVAESYGITGTPAFFVNGIPVFGAAPMQEFTQIIDDELARLEPSGKTKPQAAVTSK